MVLVKGIEFATTDLGCADVLLEFGEGGFGVSSSSVLLEEGLFLHVCHGWRFAWEGDGGLGMVGSL